MPTCYVPPQCDHCHLPAWIYYTVFHRKVLCFTCNTEYVNALEAEQERLASTYADSCTLSTVIGVGVLNSLQHHLAAL